MSEDSITYFPMFVDLSSRKVVFYGGGAIAAGRVEALLRFGAIVTVFAPDVCKLIRGLWITYPQTLKICEQPYSPGIPEADFVCSAVDDRAADEAIWRECKERRIPVNIASDKTMCDFFFPALVENQDLVIGITSGGRDHKKVKQAAGMLREFLDENKF